MKKQVLTIAGMLLTAATSIAQFTTSGIWALNQRVDPMPHNAIDFSSIKMEVTYSTTGVPLTLNTISAPMGIPKFRVTSNVNGNTIIGISSEQEDANPWEDRERATFMNNGSADTSITIETSNDGGPFTNANKLIFQYGPNANQFAYQNYRWQNDTWTLTGKNFFYLTNNKIDSTVGYTFSSQTDSIRNLYTIYYYSNGLDSTHQFIRQTSNNQFELRNKTIVELKENDKTKRFGTYAINNGNWTKTATISYSNGPSSGLSSLEQEFSISIYPNPTKDYFIVAAEGLTHISKINIHNLLGEQIYSTTKTKEAIHTAHLPKGVYMVGVEFEDNIQYKKIIID